MNRRLWHALGLALGLLWCLAPGSARAQQDILGTDMDKRVFDVTASGSIDGRYRFSGVRHQVVISFTEAGSPNPLLVIINPLPALGGKNSVFWNSNETRLTAFAGTIRSTLVTGALRQSDMRFYYMSPALYGLDRMATQHEPERVKWVDTHAEPIAVLAKTADLTLRVTGNAISGTIRIAGMDNRAHKPCQYVAHIQGQEYIAQRPKQ